MSDRSSTRRVAVLGTGLCVLGTALAARRLVRVEVVGSSMEPTLRPGDRLAVLRVGARWPLRPGALVALADPRTDGAATRLLVKRLTRINAGFIEVEGDNPSASTDSRQFGPVPRSDVVGLALYRYAPPERTGVVR
jgi:nickel-type superoxide dismutase maturation protease